MIKGSRRRGSYPDGWLECQHALEPIFLELVGGCETPFIDLATISEAIFDIGYKARWSVSDIAAAVEELAVNHQLAVAANRATDEAICNALARSVKH